MNTMPPLSDELLQAQSLAVLAVLIDGLRIDDERLNQLCLRALQSFGRNAVGRLEQLVWAPDITDSHRQRLQTAIDWISNRPPPDRHPASDVLPVLVDAFRIADERFNARALEAARLMLPFFVDNLVTAAAKTDVEPEHCLRLLEAAEHNGGTLNWQAARALSHLRNRPGFEIVQEQIDQLLASQWVMRPDRTFVGH